LPKLRPKSVGIFDIIYLHELIYETWVSNANIVGRESVPVP